MKINNSENQANNYPPLLSPGESIVPSLSIPSAPTPSTEETQEMDDPFERLNTNIATIRNITDVFEQASHQSLEEEALRTFVAANHRAETLTSAEAQREPYFYHAVREAFEDGKVSCSPPNMVHNSRIVYRVISTIWPDRQADIIRRFNVIKRKVRSQLNNPRPQINGENSTRAPQQKADLLQAQHYQAQYSLP